MDNSVIKQEFGMVGDLTTAFRDYAKSLGRMDLYNYNFTFRRDDAKGLTEDEFGKMMDYYQISEAQRYGSRFGREKTWQTCICAWYIILS